jgi:hypothetical protein
VGGANLNFEQRLRGEIIILKIKINTMRISVKTDSKDIFSKESHIHA